jgi:hypothetical protein
MVGNGMRAGVLAVLLGLGAGGCDMLDFDVNLAPQSFRLDFGQQSGTIPTVACSDAADVCSDMPPLAVDTSSQTGMPSQVEVAAGCDTSSGQCYAQASARVAQTMSVLQGDGVVSKIERHSLGFVKIADVAYTIPVNTLTFDIPKIDIYAGPAGAVRETDPGVASVGSTQPITAGKTTTESLHLTITKDTPARSVIEDAVSNKRDFVFIAVATPRMSAGSPVPAGAVQIDIAPKLVVGP